MIKINNVEMKNEEFIEAVDFLLLTRMPMKASRDSDDFKESSKWRIITTLNDLKHYKGDDDKYAQNLANHIWFVLKEAFIEELTEALFHI